MELTSEDFDDGGTIPASAADPSVGGAGRSPHLAWSAEPEGTRSFALTCWDPDAPTTVGFTHWVRFDIPTSLRHFDAGSNAAPGQWIDGITDIGETHYTGMAPPAGDEPHHYIFTLYALKTDKLDVPAAATAAYVGFNVHANVLGSATFTALYARP